MIGQQRLRLAAGFLLGLGAACHDGPTAPQAGTIRVSIQTSGGDLDSDGYALVVDSDVPRQLLPKDITGGPDGSQRFELGIGGVSAGVHSVALEGVADNCTVSGAGRQSVPVTAGRTADVAFAVTCVATGVEITTHTTGPDTPFMYGVLVEQASISIAPNAALTVSRLQPGAHTVSLNVHADNCDVVGGTQRTITVATRTITPVVFEITCLPLVRSEKIAYVVDTIANGDAVKMIALVRPDGSGGAALTLGDSPAWSPDRTRLAFSTTSCDAFAEYYGVACNGSLDMMDPERSSSITLIDGASGFSPSWAPSGDVIASTRCCHAGDRSRLFLVRIDGSPSAEVVISDGLLVTDPAWSPDGRRIAFTCFTGTSTDVCVINPDGTGFARLTSDSTYDARPAWSPDGKRIAFTRSANTLPPEIVLMTPDGGGLTRLTDGFDPAWSPDGAKLVFAGGDGLYTINADGSGRTRLTKGAHRAPAWRP